MIAVIDDLPVFRLLAKRRLTQCRSSLQQLIGHTDLDVHAFGSPSEFLFYLNEEISSRIHIVLLDYRFGEKTIEATLSDIINHPKLVQTIIIGWSRTIESIDIFRNNGAHGFIRKDRDAFLSDDLGYIITRHHAGDAWNQRIELDD